MTNWNEKCDLILHTISKMKKMSTGQLQRFLFESGLAEEFDVRQTLAELRENQYLAQTVEETGIHYILTEKGEKALAEHPLADQDAARLSERVEEYKALFEKEKDYIAEYSEQANGIIPVFLSIRKNEKVLFKISVIVHDTQTAELIKKHWMKNAQAAYESTWEAIAEGLPLLLFD